MPVDPKKKKEEEEATKEEAKTKVIAPVVTMTRSGAQTPKEIAERRKAETAEKGQTHLAATEKFAPWLTHNAKSSLSLGDAAEVGRLQREEGMSKADAEKKVKWKKDMRASGITAGEASAAARK